MKKSCLFVILLLLGLGIAPSSHGEQRLAAARVAEPPVIDGVDDDPAWNKAREITTLDKIAAFPIAIKAVYTDTEIFLRVRFPDPDESRTHKSWVWDNGRQIYTVGYDREDIFIVKWNMEPTPVDLSIYADKPYKADIWYWKACRTDPVGYADDKMHILEEAENRDAVKITARSGKTMYLRRQSDAGKSAFTVDLKNNYTGEILPRFINQHPSGSVADVQAKGVWKAGFWTLEFRRQLVTDNEDDIQFSTGKSYLFGVSRYEIAGREPNPRLSDPLYGTGDVNETLWLEFAP